MTRNLIRKGLIVLVLSALSLPAIALAQATGFPGWITGEAGLVSPLPTIGVGEAIWRGAQLLFYLVAILALIFIIYAAITMVTAAGDPTKVETARHIIMYSLIAILIAVIAFGVVSLFYTFLRR